MGEDQGGAKASISVELAASRPLFLFLSTATAEITRYLQAVHVGARGGVRVRVCGSYMNSGEHAI